MEDFSDRRPGVGAGSPAALVEARLHLALEASEMGLWDWDPTTGSLTWNERSAQMYGTTLAESSGSIADVDAQVHPEDLDHVRAALSGVIEVAGAVHAEFRVVWPDGSTHCPYGRGQALVAVTAHSAATLLTAWTQLPLAPLGARFRWTADRHQRSFRRSFGAEDGCPQSPAAAAHRPAPDCGDGRIGPCLRSVGHARQLRRAYAAGKGRYARTSCTA